MGNTPSSQPNYFPPAEQCTGQALIEMADIFKTFKNPAGEFTALKGVSACFYPGEFVSVVGKSGSGKSTLVNMITGIDHPTSGTVRVGDTYVHSLSENKMSLWRGINLGIVFQFFQLLPTLTLLENVMLPMYLAGQLTPAGREQRASELLRAVGLESMAEKLPAAVSGGQQQSAAIARALATDPPILIADEPTGNLDSHTADEVFDLFASLIDQGKSILMVTHDISLAARTTRTLLLSDGELINPWVACALPALSHSQMLWLTHHLQSRSISPGERLPFPLHEGDGLILVTGGCLEARLPDGVSDNPPVASLGEGSHLLASQLPGGIELRAAQDASLEFLSVAGPEFTRWLAEMPSALATLQESHLPCRRGESRG
jgi:putative ABC transport system ATP-binding protein